MPPRVSDQNQVVFFYESGTFGAPLTSGSRASGLWIGLVTEHTPTENENHITIRYAGTSDRNFGTIVQGPRDYEGTITYHPQDFRMFHFALGSCVDSGSPSPYAHTISELNSDGSYAFNDGIFPSFTIKDSHKSSAGDGHHQIRTYKGCRVNTLSFNVANGEAVTCELSYIAQALEIGSKTSDIPAIYDEDTTRPYMWSDVKFHLPSGTVVKEVNELTWTINNNLERRHYVNGSRVVQDIVPTQREYEVTLTLDENNTWGQKLYEQYWQGGSEFNCMVEAVINAGSEQGFIIMSGCKITSFENPSPAEGINEYSVTITPKTCTIYSDDYIEKYNPW
ncbi:MAG: phage tail tube protein [Candidatus Heimdallarchaeaceae archaeon]